MAQNHRAPATPAVLPGTPKEFPIAPEKLIGLAKKVYLEDEVGRKKSELLADNFRFEFPIVKLNRQQFLDIVGKFDFKVGIPDLNANAYDWRVDKYEPNRVWFTIRNTGTHTGTLEIFRFRFKPTGRAIEGAPECYSLVFNEQGKLTSFTGGYIMDNRVGNTKKLGGLWGTLSAIGVNVPCPRPGTWGWRVGTAVDAIIYLLAGLFHWVTCGFFKKGDQDNTTFLFPEVKRV